MNIEKYMNRAYLLMGGNVGNVKTTFREASLILEAECGVISHLSSIYITAPWGKTDQQNFLNQALLLETDLPSKKLMTEILAIEQRMGRKRLEKNGPRVIDIDILLFNDEIVRERNLTIPHPQLQYRRFALVPLAEIVPDLVHPVLNKTVRELLQECTDSLEVSLSG